MMGDTVSIFFEQEAALGRVVPTVTTILGASPVWSANRLQEPLVTWHTSEVEVTAFQNPELVADGGIDFDRFRLQIEVRAIGGAPLSTELTSFVINLAAQLSQQLGARAVVVAGLQKLLREFLPV